MKTGSTAPSRTLQCGGVADRFYYLGVVAKSAVLWAVAVVLLSGCGGGDSSSEPGRSDDEGVDSADLPVEAVRVVDAPYVSDDRTAWDVSPDGRWLAYRGANQSVCLMSVETPDGRCQTIPEVQPGELVWSPDSSKIVVLDDLRAPPYHSVIIATDGTVTDLTPIAEDFTGAVMTAAFVDADTVVYAAADEQTKGTSVYTVQPGGEPVQVGDTVTASGDSGYTVASSIVATSEGFDVHLGANELSARGVWRFADSGTEQISDDSQMVLLAHVAGVTVLHDFDALVRNEDKPFFWLTDGSHSVAIADRDGRRTVGVVLSPDGRWVARLESQRQPGDASWVSVAATGDLFDGSDTWAELSSLPEPSASPSTGRYPSPLVWTEPDRIFAEMEGALWLIPNVDPERE